MKNLQVIGFRMFQTHVANCHLILLILCSSECQNYTILYRLDRNAKSGAGRFQCDQDTPYGWYRFKGFAGTRMPTTCPPYDTCDALGPGWLDGKHPTVGEGRVTRKVCFRWEGNCCAYSTSIKITNCGSYYVYKFYNQLPGCPLRYCGSDY